MRNFQASLRWEKAGLNTKTLKDKTFYYMGKLFEHSLDYQVENLSNEEITEIVRSQIKSGMKGSSQKGKEVDWETFENVSRYFDWKKAFSFKKADQSLRSRIEKVMATKAGKQVMVRKAEKQKRRR